MFDAQYTNSDTGLIYLRARTYDPATAQFLSVDPEVESTRAPYTYGEDNPLNRTDPAGLFPGEEIVRAVIDVAEVPPYAVYYGSYELAKGINELGEKLGPVGSDFSHVVGAPLVLPQAVGLGLDILGDKLKNYLFGHESVCDEGHEGYLNPLHSYLSPGLRGPKLYLPGVHPNGKIDIEW